MNEEFEVRIEELNQEFSVAQAFSKLNLGEDAQHFTAAMSSMREDLVNDMVYNCDNDPVAKEQKTGAIKNMDAIMEHILEAPSIMKDLTEQISMLKEQISSRNTEVGSGDQ